MLQAFVARNAQGRTRPPGASAKKLSGTRLLKSSQPFEIRRESHYIWQCRATGYDNKLAMQ
jgi:hypothetical protein